jgi:hypothetical protein
MHSIHARRHHILIDLISGTNHNHVRRVDAAMADLRAEEAAGSNSVQDRDWEDYDDMEEGQTRVLETAYPMLNFGVLLRIERIDAKQAEEDAWARLLE